MMHNTLLLLGLMLAFSSCEPINFQESQPKGGQDLLEFPQEFQGMYSTDIDLRGLYKFVRIGKTECSTYSSIDQVFHIDDLKNNDNLRLEGNMVYISDPPGVFESTTKGDSIYVKVEANTTFINLQDESTVVRLFQDKLIISEKKDGDYWHVSVAKKVGEDIEYRDLSWGVGEDIEQLKQKVQRMTTFHSVQKNSCEKEFFIKPTKKEFKKLMHLFESRENKILLTKTDDNILTK